MSSVQTRGPSNAGFPNWTTYRKFPGIKILTQEFFYSGRCLIFVLLIGLYTLALAPKSQIYSVNATKLISRLA